MRQLLIGSITTLYIFCFLYYTYPRLAALREKGSHLSLGVFSNGICKYTKSMRLCQTTKWKTPTVQQQLNLLPKTVVSSIGFNYSSYYEPMTTAPMNISNPITKWTSGPKELVKYINNHYIPKYKSISKGAYERRIIYQKRQFAGMPSQIMGICEVLLIGLSHDRLVYINAPAIPSHFFDFPFFNFTFAATLPKDSEYYRISQTVDVSNATVPAINNVARFLSKLKTSPLNLDGPYKTTTVLNLGVPMFRHTFLLQHTQSFMQRRVTSMNATDFRSKWYNYCFHSVFHPSAFIQEFLEPYLQIFKEHPMIGVNIRMRGNYSEWMDKPSSMTVENVTSQFDLINRALKNHTNSMIFLATDSRYIENLMAKEFEGKVISAGELPIMHTGRYTNEAGILRAFMDAYLLARCKVLFLTQKCLFSKFVQLISVNDPPIFFF